MRLISYPVFLFSALNLLCGQAAALEECCIEECPIEVCPIEGKVSLDFSDDTGNRVSRSLELEGKLKQEACCGDLPLYKWEVEVEYEWERERRSGVGQELANRALLKGNYERRFAPCWVWRAAEEITRNLRKDLNCRFASTLGLGYYVVETCDFSLMPKVGVTRVDSQYRDDSNDSEEHNLNGSAGWELEWCFYGDLKLEWDVEVTFDVERGDRHRYYSDAEVSVPCGDCWELGFEYESIYISRPAPGKEHYDGHFTTKISYCF